MKMPFDEVWALTAAKILDEYENLGRTHMSMKMAGTLDVCVITNPYAGIEDRFLEIIGMHSENGKIEWRAWGFEKIHRTLCFANPKAAETTAALLRFQYAGSQFEVKCYREIIESRMRKLSDLYAAMVD